MGYIDVANSPLLYGAVAVGILYIVGLAAVFLKKAWSRCLALGISQKKLWEIARSSAVFTVVPSLSIVIGLFTLSTVLGIPWSWYRLSVVGSVTYELTAAEMVADGMGFSSVGDMAANADYHAFGAVMFVMSICILAGILVNLFAVEKIQKGMSNYKKKKGDWGSVMNSCFFLGIMAAFTPLIFASGFIYAMTFVVSALTAAACHWLMKRFVIRWLGSFIMSISLIASMVFAVFMTGVMG